jgi:hypothetical protein
MEKQAVEANELRFQQKVEELRSHLAGRQQAYQRKRRASLDMGVRLALLPFEQERIPGGGETGV